MMERQFSRMKLRWHSPLLCAALTICGCGGDLESPDAANWTPAARDSAPKDPGSLHDPVVTLSQPPSLKPVSYTFPLPADDGLVVDVSEPIPNIVRLPAVRSKEKTTASPARQPTQPPTIEMAIDPPVPAVTEITGPAVSEPAAEDQFIDSPRSSRWSSEAVELERSDRPVEQQAYTPREDHNNSLKRLPSVSVMDAAATDFSTHRAASDPAPSANAAPIGEVEAVEEQIIPRADPMRAVNERAEAMIRHGFSLAQRGATYSARMELIEAMRIVAEALDLRDNTRRHSDALKRGFRALEEAEDFEQRGLAAELDMEVLVASHQTPALKHHDLTSVTPLVGLQRYFTYAQEQLAIAGGEQATSSVALYGIGRLQGEMQSGERSASPQAIVFHQAAVMVDGMNYKAANELGVLLAQYGQFEQARELLAHSVLVCPHVESWRNLAKVHQRLGEHELARRAAYQSQLAARDRTRGAGSADESVRWVDPAALAGAIGPAEQTQSAPPLREAPRESTTRNVSRDESEGIMRLIPWMRRGE